MKKFLMVVIVVWICFGMVASAEQKNFIGVGKCDVPDVTEG